MKYLTFFITLLLIISFSSLAENKMISSTEIDQKSVIIFQLKVTVTAYNNTIAQTDSTPGIAAFGPVRDDMIAVSWDLKFLKNKWVYVEDIGWRYVQDLMNKRFKKRIDIFMKKDIEAAKKFGTKRGIKIQWEEKILTNNEHLFKVHIAGTMIGIWQVLSY